MENRYWLNRQHRRSTLWVAVDVSLHLNSFYDFRNIVLLSRQYIACVASVSVAQRAKNGGFGVLPARKMGREQNRKEGGGGGEGRNRLRTNPWILKTSVRQRTELLIGWNRRLLLTCVDHRSYKVLLRARIQHGGRRGRLFRSVFAQSINFSRQSRI